jgi:hypothetical protein
VDIQFHRALSEWEYDMGYDYPPASAETIRNTSDLLLDTLSTFSTLKNLSIMISSVDYHVDSFTQAMNHSSINLPHIQRLTLGPHSHSIIDHLPALSVVHMEDWTWYHDQEAYQPLMIALSTRNITEATVKHHRGDDDLDGG